MIARLIDDITWPVLSIVAVAAVLAFGFDAPLDIIIAVLLLGIVTVLAESRIRSRI
ncbi:hypothetical protein [Tardiphaga alba]|uniref:hypothetical protein n=1 Tax=Tardiphaga alba TaxID=340268 RepID=UPI001BAAFB89|nr:hypothetical protein [Tardiphaga alba]